MRVPVRRSGLGAAAASTFVQAQQGVSQANSDAACTAAGGTPGFSPTTDPGGLQPFGCNVPELPSLPGYCSWFPFATSLFSACDTTTGAGGAISQPVASAYTLYSVGQQSGLDAEAAAAQTAADMEASYPEPDCAYTTTANNPALAQIFGSDITASLLNPFTSGCGSIPGWVYYAGIALLIMAFTGALGGRSFGRAT